MCYRHRLYWPCCLKEKPTPEQQMHTTPCDNKSQRGHCANIETTKKDTPLAGRKTKDICPDCKMLQSKLDMEWAEYTEGLAINGYLVGTKIQDWTNKRKTIFHEVLKENPQWLSSDWEEMQKKMKDTVPGAASAISDAAARRETLGNAVQRYTVKKIEKR